MVLPTLSSYEGTAWQSHSEAMVQTLEHSRAAGTWAVSLWIPETPPICVPLLTADHREGQTGLHPDHIALPEKPYASISNGRSSSLTLLIKLLIYSLLRRCSHPQFGANPKLHAQMVPEGRKQDLGV